jgi:threonine/homoserine/homoserine lactone efflux protein
MIDPVPFATFSLVMSITPGPNNIMLTASGATFGFRRTLPHMIGICTGCALQLLAVCAGLGALFSLWPQVQTVLRYAGAAYLLYLGWRMLKSRLGDAQDNARPFTFTEAALFQALNPKAWIMSLTAATVFMPRELGTVAADTYMVSTMVLITLPCVAIWALFGTSLRTVLNRPGMRTGFNVVMALALAVTGIIMVM